MDANSGQMHSTVPVVSTASPGFATPQPRALTIWSCEPMTTLTLCGRPSAEAASCVSVPAHAPVDRTAGSVSGSMPQALVSSSDQQSFRTSKRMLRQAREQSATVSPDRQKQI